MNRSRSMVLLFVLLALAGFVAIAIGLLAQARLNPSVIEWDGLSYEIVVTDTAQARRFTLRHAGREVATLSGNTDRLCDLPYTMWLDIGDDGVKDLYFHGCGKHGYLSAQDGEIQFINLGQWDPQDAPAVSNWWGSAIRSAGATWRVTGGLALLLGLLGLLWSVRKAST